MGGGDHALGRGKVDDSGGIFGANRKDRGWVMHYRGALAGGLLSVRSVFNSGLVLAYQVGLGRAVALHHRSSAPHQISPAPHQIALVCHQICAEIRRLSF